MGFDPAPFTADEAAAPVLAHLAGAKWRKARDLAKELCKQDKPRYLPLVIAANEGLAREMLGKGQVKEAAEVIAYLKTIAPPELIQSLQETKEVAVVTSAGGAAAATAVDRWNSVLILAAVVEAGGSVSAEQLAVVDGVVASFFSPPAGEPGSPAARVAEELKSVLAACEATATGQWEAAQTALRLLPRRSIFQHWRMLLRGVRHAHQDEAALAQQCFATLPEGSATARAATLWQLALGLPVPANVRAPVNAKAGGLAALVGAPSSCGLAIAQAAREWKAGQRIDCLATLTKEFRSGFPTDEPGLLSVLSDAVLSTRNSSRVEADLVSEFADDVFHLLDAPRLSPGQQLRLARFCAVAQAEELTPPDVEEDWQRVITLAGRFYGPSGVRDSMLWLQLARNMAKKESIGIPFFGRSRPRDEKRALKAFTMAVTADPLNEEAQMGLLSFYREHGTPKQLAGHVEFVIRHLPNHKESLREAGRLAVARKAYGKGLDFLRRVRQLDPLDREAGGQIILALISQAVEARKKKPGSLPGIWAELESSPGLGEAARLDPAVIPMTDPRLERWAVKLIQSLIDPDPAAAAACRAEGTRLAPSATDAVILQKLAGLHYKLPSAPEVERDWKALVAAATLTDVWRAAVINFTWWRLVDGSIRRMYSSSNFLNPILAAAGEKSPATDFEGLRLLTIYFLSLHRARLQNGVIHFQAISEALSPALEKAAKPATADARLKLALLAGQFLRYFPATVSEAEKLTARLRADGHVQWVAVGELLAEAIDRADKGFEGCDEDEEFDDKEEEGDFDDFSDEPDLPEFNLSEAEIDEFEVKAQLLGLPPGGGAVIAAIQLSPPELQQEFKERLMSTGMTEEQWCELLALLALPVPLPALRPAPTPVPKPAPKPAPKPKPKPVSADQLEFELEPPDAPPVP